MTDPITRMFDEAFAPEHATPAKTLTDADVARAIKDELDGCEWTPETLEAIAAIMRRGGYCIREYDPDEDEGEV